MTTAPQDEMRVYFARVKPVYCELFSMAHAILGNYELAEYAAQQAILEGWQRSQGFAGKLGFREGLRAGVKRIAYAETLMRRGEKPEFTWNGFEPDVIDGAPDEPFAQMAAQESLEVRRVLALRYGCGFLPSAISKLTDMSTGQIRQVLYRFENRLRKKLKGSVRRRVDTYCFHAVRQEFARGEQNMPDPGTVFRTFQVEAAGTPVPRKKLRRVAYAVLCALLIALMGGVFWLAAVLIQPPTLEPDAEPAAEDAWPEAPAPADSGSGWD